MRRPRLFESYMQSTRSWWSQRPLWHAWRALHRLLRTCAWWVRQRIEKAKKSAERNLQQWFAVPRRVGLYVLLSIATLVWNYGTRLSGFYKDHVHPCDLAVPSPSEDKAVTLFKLFLRWQSRGASEPVAVVYIPAERIDLQQNTCTARAYLNRLLNVVAQQDAQVVVVDKSFSESSCRQAADAKITQDLVTTVQHYPVPIVVGLSASTTNDAQQNEGVCLRTDGALDFGDAPNLKHALLRANVDLAKIPLRWKTPSVGGGPPNEVDGLALAAYRVSEQAVAQPVFQSLLSARRNPFANLWTQLACVSSEVLLGNQPQNHQDAACIEHPVKTLSRKVVVIGAQGGGDLTQVMGQDYWGYNLQALYLNALLTGGYMLAPPFEAILLTYFAFWIAYLLLFPPSSQTRRDDSLLLRYWRSLLKPLLVMFGLVLISAAIFLELKWLPPLAVYGSYLPVLVLQILTQAQSSEKQAISRVKV